MIRVSSWVLWACCAKSLWIAFGKDEVLDWLVWTTLILLLICSSFSSEIGHPVLIYSSLSTAQYTLCTWEYHTIGTELKSNKSQKNTQGSLCAPTMWVNFYSNSKGKLYNRSLNCICVSDICPKDLTWLLINYTRFKLTAGSPEKTTLIKKGETPRTPPIFGFHVTWQPLGKTLLKVNFLLGYIRQIPRSTHRG